MVLSNGFFYERIQLDTINERFNKVPTAKEGDANGRGMIVVLTENGLVKNTTGVSLLFKWEHTRIAGAQGLEDFEPLDLTKGEYIVTYPTEMNHEGYVKAEIRIIDNGKYAGSRNMKIQVEPSVGDDTAMESSNQFSALVTALLQVNSWNTTIDGKIVEWEADMEATKQLYIDTMNDVEATYPQELLSLGSQLAQTIKVFNVLNYGAIGNGVDDDTLAFKRAITALELVGGGTLYIPKGRYKITSILTINSSAKIMGDESNKPSLDFSGVSGYAILIKGSVKKTVALSGDINASSSAISVTSSEGIVSGDLLSIKDIEGTWTVDPTRNYSAGQLSRVVNVNGNEITLDGQTETAYTSQAYVTVYNKVQCEVRNIDIYRDVEMGGGVRIEYSDEFLVENVSTNNTTTEGISCSFSTNGEIRHNQATNHGYDTETGYGVVAYNSTNINIHSNTFTRGRKGVDVSGSIPSRYITIENNVASDMSSAGFGPHGTAQYISILNNMVTGFKSASGINLRGKDITVDGNIINVRTNPIVIADVAGSVVITNNVSSGKSGDSWTSYGVRYLGGVSDLDLLAIKNNVFEGSGVNGMIKLESDSKIGICNISFNTITTQFTSGVGIEAGLNQKVSKLTIQSNQYNKMNTKEKNLSGNPNITNLIFFGGEEPLAVVNASKGIVIPRVSVRPTGVQTGTVIIDQTLMKIIWWNGNAWYDSTGIIMN